MRKLLWIVVVTSSTACLRQTEFKCTSSDQCGAGGTCESSVGFCSFPDSQCGQRFGDAAGPYANQCVGGGSVDGGPIDGRVVDARGDASPIDGSTSCGSDYASIAGAPAHRYKVVPAGAWSDEVAACARATPLSYLVIPDDATEATALDTLGTGTYWAGISESGGTFPNVKGATQTFLPWAPGQPSTTGNSHCVEVSTSGATDGKLDLQKCATVRPAICECEP